MAVHEAQSRAVARTSFARWLRVRYLAALGAVAAVAALTIAMTLWQARNAAWVAHSRDVLRVARDARNVTLDGEAAVRGYLLTGDARFLEPERAGRVPLRGALDSLIALTADNAEQQARAREISGAIEEWRGASVEPVVAAALAGTRPVVDSAALAAARLRIDEVRAAFAGFVGAEQRLYDERRRTQSTARWASLAAVLLATAVLWATLHRLRRELLAQGHELLDQQARLQEQAVELEHQVDQSQQQAVELEEMNDALSTANDELGRTNDELAASNGKFEEANARLAASLDATAAAERAAEEARDRWHATVRRLRFILGSSPLAIAIVDRSGRIELANRAFSELGSDGDEASLVGQPLADVLPAHAAVLRPLVAQALAGDEPDTNVEVTVADEPPADGADGPPGARTWSGRVYPVRGADWEVIGCGVLMLDITDQRALEDQYRHAQRLEAVGRLTGGIAHDFNNILTAIAGFGELVAEALPEEGTMRADMAQVLFATQRATALTRQLLAFSRQQVLRPDVVDLNEIVRTIEALLRRLIGEDITLVTRAARDLWPVLADPGQLEQVLMNLAVNARDAMPDGGRLVIETRNVELDEQYARRHLETTPGPHVLLAITDTGTGMDEATRARIFEPFFTTKPAGSGTGLGLSTVYGIVKQSGGGLEVYSEPGIGTTFKVYLPRHVGEAHRHTPVGALPVLADRPATVLLVEDDATVAAVVRRVLEEHGYRLLLAPNGRAALELLTTEADAVHLVITDLVMPELGGRALADELAAARPGIPVLFMSGYTAEAIDQRAVLPADAAFLEKPFRAEDLLRQVRRLLGGRRVDR